MYPMVTIISENLAAEGGTSHYVMYQTYVQYVCELFKIICETMYTRNSISFTLKICVLKL